MYPMRRWIETGSTVVSIPKTLALPEVGRMRSSSTRIVVVLPAPFGPRKPNTSPCPTARSTSMIPRCFPYDFVSRSVSITFTTNTLDCEPRQTLRPGAAPRPSPSSRSGGPGCGRFRPLLQRGQLGLQARADPGPIQAQQDATHPRVGLEALQRDPDDHRSHPETGVPPRACRRPVRAGRIEVQSDVAPGRAARVVERCPYDVRWRVHEEAALDGPARESWMGIRSHAHRLVDRSAVSMPGLSHRPGGAPGMRDSVVTWSARAPSRSP